MSHSFSVPESFCFMSSRATSQVCHLAVKSDDQQCIPGIIAVQIVFLLLFWIECWTIIQNFESNLIVFAFLKSYHL